MATACDRDDCRSPGAVRVWSTRLRMESRLVCRRHAAAAVAAGDATLDPVSHPPVPERPMEATTPTPIPPTGATPTPTPTTKAPVVCATRGCDASVKARGLCSAHYEQQRRNEAVKAATKTAAKAAAIPPGMVLVEEAAVRALGETLAIAEGCSVADLLQDAGAALAVRSSALTGSEQFRAVLRKALDIDRYMPEAVIVDKVKDAVATAAMAQSMWGEVRELLQCPDGNPVDAVKAAADGLKAAADLRGRLLGALGHDPDTYAADDTQLLFELRTLVDHDRGILEELQLVMARLDGVLGDSPVSRAGELRRERDELRALRTRISDTLGIDPAMDDEDLVECIDLQRAHGRATLAELGRVVEVLPPDPGPEARTVSARVAEVVAQAQAPALTAAILEQAGVLVDTALIQVECAETVQVKVRHALRFLLHDEARTLRRLLVRARGGEA